MNDQDEPFCNPIAPSDARSQPVQKQNLSNDDFRKLMMTPSSNKTTSQTFGSKIPLSVRGSRRQVLVNDDFKKPQVISSDKKKSKKKYHHSSKKEGDEEDLLSELAKKYRDRAKERRENANPDYEAEKNQNSMSYNAVSHLTNQDAAERRKQIIEESKYLGGDMQHTHLVKGLDYALLQKVKAEIEFQQEQEKQMAEASEEEDSDGSEKNEEDWSIKSIFAKNVMKILFENNLPEKNDYFLPGRMAYVFDLENECCMDSFTSVIRSKADCPNWESNSTLSTNDIVINKLIKIFEESKVDGKRKKKDIKEDIKSDGQSSDQVNYDGFTFKKSKLENQNHKKTLEKKVENDLSIYDDIDEYILPHKLDKKDSSEKDNPKKKYEQNLPSSRYDKNYKDHSSRESNREKNHHKDRYRNYSSDRRKDRRESYKKNSPVYKERSYSHHKSNSYSDSYKRRRH